MISDTSYPIKKEMNGRTISYIEINRKIEVVAGEDEGKYLLYGEVHLDIKGLYHFLGDSKNLNNLKNKKSNKTDDKHKIVLDFKALYDESYRSSSKTEAIDGLELQLDNAKIIGRLNEELDTMLDFGSWIARNTPLRYRHRFKERLPYKMSYLAILIETEIVDTIKTMPT